MTTWETVKQNYSNACSLLRQVMASLGYNSLLVLCTALGWYLGGALIAGVGFLIALGIAFILIDVSHAPADGECEENQPQKKQNL